MVRPVNIGNITLLEASLPYKGRQATQDFGAHAESESAPFKTGYAIDIQTNTRATNLTVTGDPVMR